jgi:hypothetical protein
MGEGHKGGQGGTMNLFDSSSVIVLCGEKKLDKLRRMDNKHGVL